MFKVPGFRRVTTHLSLKLVLGVPFAMLQVICPDQTFRSAQRRTTDDLFSLITPVSCDGKLSDYGAPASRRSEPSRPFRLEFVPNGQAIYNSGGRSARSPLPERYGPIEIPECYSDQTGVGNDEESESKMGWKGGKDEIGGDRTRFAMPIGCSWGFEEEDGVSICSLLASERSVSIQRSDGDAFTSAEGRACEWWKCSFLVMFARTRKGNSFEEFLLVVWYLLLLPAWRHHSTHIRRSVPHRVAAFQTNVTDSVPDLTFWLPPDESNHKSPPRASSYRSQKFAYEVIIYIRPLAAVCHIPFHFTHQRLTVTGCYYYCYSKRHTSASALTIQYTRTDERKSLRK
ncbi:uncharacterized protein RSE6_12376 [Rhynchosporium secalis]|uniref:Uncharacterized protein n=1 Tax=Rhynchosporium secalis TaxID=38038 RepID=A0A1E1MR65_RHYSE|nr:uncharacterized protein RSE6_12376 [Rhynchosporium secalis]